VLVARVVKPLPGGQAVLIHRSILLSSLVSCCRLAGRRVAKRGVEAGVVWIGLAA
jgi:hypothetical protein